MAANIEFRGLSGDSLCAKQVEPTDDCIAILKELNTMYTDKCVEQITKEDGSVIQVLTTLQEAQLEDGNSLTVTFKERREWELSNNPPEGAALMLKDYDMRGDAGFFQFTYLVCGATMKGSGTTRKFKPPPCSQCGSI
eukprot:TRINITY_DN8903_c0_g1_i3.p1 TRINITY_DN8903_c0_g1~~TRINITY_DN8903_c0_g1_i3.p1  ORF type:complete len:138 (-),score=19.73 TRINITY_DN8903_c0_g1_i3:150-563(-)